MKNYILLFLVFLYSCNQTVHKDDYRILKTITTKALDSTLTNNEESYVRTLLTKSINDTAQFDSYRALGMSLIYKGKFNDAKDYFYKASQINVAKDKPLNDLGYTYLKLDSVDKALCFLDSAIKINPENFKAREHRHNYYLESKKYKKALDDALYFHIHGNSSSLTLSNIGYYYMMLEDFNESERYISMAIKSNNNCDYCYVNLAELKLKQGQAQEAIQILDQTFTLDPPTVYAQYVKLMALKKLNLVDDYCSLISTEFLYSLKEEFNISYSPEFNCE